ncbi:hypothetical protein SADUNF_Sadunf17G0100600 [Salix dunnii]|uniref:C-JID domain-containing protein n=2 Tax=Salix dunnii TaxID=1413687 RepID=A0A835MHJ3_9ROSI|nr:hypothetical protein SADUNF_Sadunf17G0100600 [Salix dunnii]
MNKLMVLRLDEIGVTELSSSIHHLIGLGLLSMNSCKNLTRIPEGIGCLKLLKKLDLSGCSGLEYITQNLGEVESLEEFDLSGTSIQELPASISLLKNLKVLYLDGCKRIVVLPSLSGLCSLEIFGLCSCHLKEGVFLEDIVCLSSLKSLDLSQNNFVSLPRSINMLSRLEMLVLEDCRMLESLLEVPSKVQIVNLNGCIRLRNIPDPIKLSSSKRSEFLCLNCWELYKHNDQDSMGFTKLARYLQGLSNPRPGFGIIVPGNEIIGCFNHQKKGSSISMEVHNWSMGFVACVAFSASSENPSLVCHFKANRRENYPSPMGISFNSIQVLSDHLWIFYLSFDYLKQLEEWQHESFSSIELSFHSSKRVKMPYIRRVPQVARTRRQRVTLAAYWVELNNLVMTPDQDIVTHVTRVHNLIQQIVFADASFTQYRNQDYMRMTLRRTLLPRDQQLLDEVWEGQINQNCYRNIIRAFLPIQIRRTLIRMMYNWGLPVEIAREIGHLASVDAIDWWRVEGALPRRVRYMF